MKLWSYIGIYILIEDILPPQSEMWPDREAATQWHSRFTGGSADAYAWEQEYQ